MRRSLAKFSESEASNHTPSLADFTTTTPELKFSVHTARHFLHSSASRYRRQRWQSVNLCIRLLHQHVGRLDTNPDHPRQQASRASVDRRRVRAGPPALKQLVSN